MTPPLGEKGLARIYQVSASGPIPWARMVAFIVPPLTQSNRARMNSARISPILSSLILLLSLGAFVSPALGQDLETVESQFRKAATSKDAEKRTAALDALVALGDAGAVPVLIAEHARLSIKVRKAEKDSSRAKYALDRIEGLIKAMEFRFERDPSLEESVKAQREKRDDLKGKYEDGQRIAELWRPWRDEVSAGATILFTGLAKGKRKKAEKAIWVLAEEATDYRDRLAAIELIGRIGGDGSAIGIQKLYFEMLAKRSKTRKLLQKLNKDVRKLEQRLQEEAERDGRGASAATQQQYFRVRQESAELRKQLTLESYISDACIEAGGRALAREEGAVLDKSLAALVRSLGKGKSGAYVGLLEMLGAARVEPVRVRLRSLLSEAKSPLGRATLLEALGTAGDVSMVDEIVAVHLADESWLVRSSAAAALSTLRDKRGVPALIDRLAIDEEGRIRTDISKALVLLTGKDYRTNVTLWQRWWKEAEATFEVPELGIEVEASGKADDSVGLTFFGIRTESQRVLFVLDLSGSMEFSMVPRENPDDDTRNGREGDKPQDGEISRLVAAKRDLQKAMGGLEDDALFNVIFYASDVWSWKDNLVKMDSDSRQEVTEVIEELRAVGGTNIYGAMQAAFKMAGAKAGNEWVEPKVDTIFLLSDGKPSIGISTDADEILSMVREANENVGITIHTIGLSGAQDAYLLRTLAEENGGTYAAR